MNYILELKAFYDSLEINPLPSPAIALWHALMHIANKTGWQQEFTVAISVLGQKAGLNAQAVKRARNVLAQNGYITWRARKGNQSAIYTIESIVVQNNAKNVPQNEPQVVPQSEPQVVPQSEPINKLKQNETNKKNTKKKSAKVSAGNRFSNFEGHEYDMDSLERQILECDQRGKSNEDS